jgi:hypothetical protein
VSHPGPAEPGRVIDVAQHADDEPGPGSPGGQHPAFAGGDHGDLPHIADTEPQDRGQDQIGPGQRPGHVVRAQHQVRALPPVEPFHDQAQRGPGKRGQQAHLDPGRGELGHGLVRAGQRQRAEPVHGGQE